MQKVAWWGLQIRNQHRECDKTSDNGFKRRKSAARSASLCGASCPGPCKRVLLLVFSRKMKPKNGALGFTTVFALRAPKSNSCRSLPSLYSAVLGAIMGQVVALCAPLRAHGAHRGRDTHPRIYVTYPAARRSCKAHMRTMKLPSTWYSTVPVNNPLRLVKYNYAGACKMHTCSNG